MRIELDNAQNTPHLDIIDDKGIIQSQISFCSDTVLIDGKKLEDFPEKDGILIYPKRKTVEV